MFVPNSVISNLDLSKIILAIGGLGTAAYGLVDATKGFGGGISNRGFGDIKAVISDLIPDRPGSESGLTQSSVLLTLRANWLNGMALTDQKAVAKSLVKLKLTPNSAKEMAKATGVDANTLAAIAGKLGTEAGMTAPEADAYGRFDLSLSALVDQGYQRADQRYRNSAKLLAIPISVALAVVAALVMDGGYVCMDIWKAVIGGILATPLAPVAKDLSSALQAGAKLAQSWKK